MNIKKIIIIFHCHPIDFKSTVELPMNATFYIQFFKKQYLIFNCFVNNCFVNKFIFLTVLNLSGYLRNNRSAVGR